MTGLMNGYRYDRIEAIDKELKLNITDETRKALIDERKKLLDLCLQSNRMANLGRQVYNPNDNAAERSPLIGLLYFNQLRSRAMSNPKIYLTTIEGELAIIKSKIVAVLSVDIKVPDSEHTIKAKVFIDGDDAPFNVLEDFQYVSDKI